MNVTTDGCFRITWYFGFFCIIEVIIPEDAQPFDDEWEELVSGTVPADSRASGAGGLSVPTVA